MANPYYSDYKETSALTPGSKSPKLGTPAPKPRVSQTQWPAPKSPGKRRKIFKPLGRHVRTATREE